MKARQEVTKATGGQYRGASKKEKGKLLDQFIATTGYSRWYARLVLRHEGRRIQTQKAKVAVARKLLIRAYIMLRDEIDYAEFRRRAVAARLARLGHRPNTPEVVTGQPASFEG